MINYFFIFAIFSSVPASETIIEDPSMEKEKLVKFYKNKFPEKNISEYIYGAMMFSNDAKSQFNSIMAFIPFSNEIERGKKIWNKPFKNGKTFSDCFKRGGIGQAANFPKYNSATDTVVTFEMEINNCLSKNGEKTFKYNDVDTMGVVTAYARKLSDGFPTNIEITHAGAVKKFNKGRETFFKRIGQLNLSCASCHITYAGNFFRDERISPAIGQTPNYPVFRGGEFLFTLHMRYQRCMEAMRANPFKAGSSELNNLEYFHSYLSNELPLNASVYRK